MDRDQDAWSRRPRLKSRVGRGRYHESWTVPNYPRRLAANIPIDELLGQGSVHCGLIEGGEELSSYPALCKIKVEFRTVLSQSAEGILADLNKILQSLAAADGQFKYQEPKILLQRPPLRLPMGLPLVKAADSAASHALNRAVVVGGFPAWCDAALLSEAGIPAVVFGPEGDGLHAREEWVDAESIRTTTTMLSTLIADCCQ